MTYLHPRLSLRKSIWWVAKSGSLTDMNGLPVLIPKRWPAWGPVALHRRWLSERTRRTTWSLPPVPARDAPPSSLSANTATTSRLHPLTKSGHQPKVSTQLVFSRQDSPQPKTDLIFEGLCCWRQSFHGNQQRLAQEGSARMVDTQGCHQGKVSRGLETVEAIVS